LIARSARVAQGSRSMNPDHVDFKGVRIYPPEAFSHDVRFFT